MATTTLYADSSASVNRLAHTYVITLVLVLSLTKKEGYCYAHNDALCEMRQRDRATIKRHISLLVRLGYLIREDVGNDRYLYPGKKYAPPMPPSCAGSSTIKRTSTKVQQNSVPPAPVFEPEQKAAPVAVPPATPALPDCTSIAQNDTANSTSPPCASPDPVQAELLSAGFSRKDAALLSPLVTLETLRAYRAYCDKRGYLLGGLRRAIEEGWNVPEVKPMVREPYRLVVKESGKVEMPDFERKREEAKSLREIVEQGRRDARACPGQNMPERQSTYAGLSTG